MLTKYYLATTDEGQLLLYPNLEELAQDAFHYVIERVREIDFDPHWGTPANHAAAEAMLAAFNAQGLTDMDSAPELARAMLAQDLYDTALKNTRESDAASAEIRAHERAELSNLHTL